MSIRKPGREVPSLLAPRQQQVTFASSREMFSTSAAIIDRVERDRTFKTRSSAYRVACYTYFTKGPGMFSGPVTRRVECLATCLGHDSDTAINALMEYSSHKVSVGDSDLVSELKVDIDIVDMVAEKADRGEYPCRQAHSQVSSRSNGWRHAVERYFVDEDHGFSDLTIQRLSLISKKSRKSIEACVVQMLSSFSASVIS